MTKPQPPFDSEAYLNYKKLLEEKQSNNFVEDVTKVGFKIDQALAKIIDQLDMIIEQLEEEEDE